MKEPPTDLDRCLAILVLRRAGCSQDEVASILHCAKLQVGEVERWITEQLSYSEAVKLCIDAVIKKVIDIDLIPNEDVDKKLVEKVVQITGDDIIRLYRKADYMKAEEPDIQSVATQLKVQLLVPAPEDILINDFGGPGRHKIYSKQDTYRVIQENLGYGISIFKTMRESSPVGGVEITLEVSTYGNLKLLCLVKGKDYTLSKKLISSLSEIAQQKFEAWKQRGGQYLGKCSEIYQEIHTEARYKTFQSIYEAVFSKFGPPPLTPLFGDLVYQLCILYRRSRGQYGLPDRRLYQIKRSGFVFFELYLNRLHLANAPLSLPRFPPPPRALLLPHPPPPPSFLETWIDLHRNMIVKWSASPAITELLALFQELRGIEAAIKKELDGLIPGKQP